jgi:general stress protein CsbA
MGLDGWILTIGLIIGGFMASSSLFVKKNENFEKIVKVLSTWQGWIGIGVMIGGIIVLIMVLASGILRYVNALFIILYLGSIILAMVLGFLMAIGLLRTRKEIPQDKLEKVNKIISGFGIPLGIAGLIMGIFWLLNNFIHFGFLYSF